MRLETDGAMSRKPSDRYTVPLCGCGWKVGCHYYQHGVGEETFWDGFPDPLDLAARLWSLSRKYSGDELIERGRYAVKMWRER